MPVDYTAEIYNGWDAIVRAWRAALESALAGESAALERVAALEEEVAEAHQMRQDQCDALQEEAASLRGLLERWMRAPRGTFAEIKVLADTQAALAE